MSGPDDDDDDDAVIVAGPLGEDDEDEDGDDEALMTALAKSLANEAGEGGKKKKSKWKKSKDKYASKTDKLDLAVSQVRKSVFDRRGISVLFKMNFRHVYTFYTFQTAFGSEWRVVCTQQISFQHDAG